MDIAIIGAGVSGLILASKLKGHNITLFEGNAKVGKKLLLTGNGKCNFTNDNFVELDKIYNNDFARAIYKRYDNKSFIDYLYKLGVESKIETHKDRQYYYPNSNKSSSVCYALLDKCIDNKAKILLNTKVIDVIKSNNKFSVVTEKGTLIFDKVVVSTGGMSYSNTGSDGNFYKIIKNLGLSVKDLVPGLTALSYKGKAIENVRIDALVNVYIIRNNVEKLIYKEYGEIQFTNFGISGIPIMNASRYTNREITNGNKIILSLNLVAKSIDDDISLPYMIDKLKVRRDNIAYKDSNNFLCGMIADEIANIILLKTKIKAKKVSQISDSEIENIARQLLDFKLEIDKYASFDNAQITLGGIKTDEINVQSLESKKVPGLYFTGEIMDIDGMCGGYNLQLCYSSASIVADSINGV